MIPILYESTESTYQNNGIGRLADAISCTVTEELNGAYELEMVYPVTGGLFDKLSTERIILAKPADTGRTQPFRIKKISKPLNGLIKIYAQHKSYDLNAIPVAPFNTTGIATALNGLNSNALLTTGYTVWTDITNTSTPFNNTQVRSFRACLGGSEGSILDAFRQVEYEWDRNTVKAHQYRGTDKGVSIRYGKNLTDINHETSSEAVYTGVLAQWIDTDSGACVYGDIQPTASTSPVQRVFIYDATSDFEEAPTASQLNDRATKYISDNGLDSPALNITVSFVALWQTEEYKDIASLERVSMGDTVHVFFTKYGINATAKVIKTVYDVLKERYTSIELGRARASLSQTIKQATGADLASSFNSLSSYVRSVSGQISQTQADLEERMAQAIADAADAMTGGTGGYVYVSRNGAGQPNEIYIMDSPSTGTAVKVIRMNMNGIAGSSNGVNGPWNMAILTDGQIVADAITTGELNGALIRAGTILTSALEVDAYNAVNNFNSHFSFQSDGMHITMPNAAYQSLFSNKGMRVITKSGVPTLIAEEDSVTAENFTANNFLMIAGSLATARFQTYHDNVDDEDMFGCFWEETE